MSEIEDVRGLESVVGARPRAMMMKSIDRLDDHCRAVIDRSTAAVVAYRDDSGLRARLVGGAPGFAWDSPTSLAIDAPDGAVAGTPVGACFLTPGWRETLRVNGTFSSRFDVSEALVHCGKAVIRSKLWDVPAVTGAQAGSTAEAVLDHAARAFLAEAPFLIIGSCDADGNADASPKGDPGGFVHVIDDATIAIPDRNGNKRTDTLHNVLDDPTVAIIALSPGDDRTLELGGRARISTEAALLASMAMNGKRPNVAIIVDLDRVQLEASEGLSAADLWNADHHIARNDLPVATRIWTDHVESNRTTGLAAGAIKFAARAAKIGDTSAAAKAALNRDYEKNLY
jgi:PPOX class probable FMN-dependent enzyme